MADEDSGAQRQISGLAIASLICGIVWIFGLASLLAIIFGHLARRQIKRRGLRGGMLALLGLVLGYVGLVGMVMLLLLLQDGVEISDNVPE